MDPGRHALCRWDIHYTHVIGDVLQYLERQNIHVAIVPPKTTDDLQQMDVGVNGPFKSYLKRSFTNWRASQSIEQMRQGVKAEDVYVNYGLTALKNLHVQWTSTAWKLVEENGFISDSFRKVDENLVGYTHWDDSWIVNEYKTNGYQVYNEIE